MTCCAGKTIKVDAHRTTVGAKRTYGCVNMADFLEELTKRLEPNPVSMKNFKRMYSPKTLHKVEPNSPLETAVLYDRVQVRARLRNRTLTLSSANVP